ncbi:MAG: amidohydrolase family protein [Synergistaceae bacterium]|nr:amidohydrolase family protein [Synergistaceae bacterium]
MIIDFHTHIFPDGFADHAMAALSQNAKVGYSAPATLHGLISSMDECGVDRSVVLNVVTKENQHENVLRFAKETNSERIISFGSVLPSSVYALEYIWKISDEELKGVKFHPALQRIYPADEQYFPIYDLARALNLIVTFHVGFDPSYPDELNASPESMLKIAKNFPGLRIVAAHLGGLKMAENVLDAVAGQSDIYMDTAYCADPWLDRGLLREIIKKHGAERILFGSDYPWHLPSMEISLIRSLDISEEEKEMILGGNARQLLGI